ncbi:hypothetical protein KQI65_10575 [bacterium]|nr:hypothetical protein [bacterium]
MQDDSAFEQFPPPILENSAFETKLLRQLGLITYGGATFGECYSVAVTMTEWNLPGWVQSWEELAQTVEKAGDEALAKGHEVSAKESFLRATIYYHAAEYYALIGGEDFRREGMKSADCFEKAMPLLMHHAEIVSIPGDTHSYPCYFFAPDSSGKARPTIVLVPGIESSGEEQYFYAAISAVRRGFNAFVFQGPGQNGMMRMNAESHLRHDFEVPLKDALDYLETRTDVDNEQLVMLGSGLGGYFASRCAAFDSRIKALIVNPPFVNIHRVFLALIGQRATKVDVSLSDIHELPDSILPTTMKLFVLNMCRRFGVSRLQELIQATRQYSVEDLLYRIHCPVLCLYGDAAYPELEEQADMFVSRVTSEVKDSIRVPSIHVADAHDHVGNIALLNQMLFDWLEERFGE